MSDDEDLRIIRTGYMETEVTPVDAPEKPLPYEGDPGDESDHERWEGEGGSYV